MVDDDTTPLARAWDDGDDIYIYVYPTYSYTYIYIYIVYILLIHVLRYVCLRAIREKLRRLVKAGLTGGVDAADGSAASAVATHITGRLRTLSAGGVIDAEASREWSSVGGRFAAFMAGVCAELRVGGRTALQRMLAEVERAVGLAPSASPFGVNDALLTNAATKVCLLVSN